MRVSLSRPRSESAARVFSFVGLPPILALPTALLAGVRAGGTLGAALSVGGFLITSCLLPTLLTVALVRAGRASTFDLRERRDRLLPSLATAGGCACAWGLLVYAAAPPTITRLALAVSIQMAVLALLTVRWKVSYHTASASALVVVGHSATGWLLTLVLLILALCIGWARIYQRRHTLTQVAIGALTAAPIALLT